MNIVFDIDGTICHDGQTIPIEIETFLNETILRNPVHRLIFASARPVRDIIPLLSNELRQTYLIGGNGTMIYYQDKPIYLNTLPPRTTATLISYIQNNKLDYMIDESWDYAFSGAGLAELKAKVDVLEKAKNLPIDEIKSPVKMLIANYSDEIKVKNDLAHLELDVISYPRENCLDLLSKGINKASALRHILGESPYIAFGNDLNDLEMLTAANYSVCVGDNHVIQAVATKSISTTSGELIQTLKQLIAR